MTVLKLLGGGYRMRSFRTERFKAALDALPEPAQAAARKAFDLFRQNPQHPSLSRERLRASPGIEAVRVGIRWRAFLRRGGLPGDRDVVVWEWIGSSEQAHALYSQGIAVSAPRPPAAQRKKPEAPARVVKEVVAFATTKKEETVGVESGPLKVAPAEVVARFSRRSPADDMREAFVTIMRGIDEATENATQRVREAQTNAAKVAAAAERTVKGVEAELARLKALEDDRTTLLANHNALRAETERLKAELARRDERARQLEADLAKRPSDAPTREEVARITKELTGLRAEARRRGPHCQFCGRHHQTGLLPGEKDEAAA